MRGLPPDECMRSVNETLCADSGGAMFVTCFYAVLDTRTGLLEFCNAGHNPPMRLRSDGRVESTELTGGFMLGAFCGAPYGAGSLQLGAGDTLVLFTDGVTEAVDASDEQYGDERLAGCLARHAGASAEDLVRAVVHVGVEFAAGAPPADDTTVLAITWAADASAAIV
jgi:sigma-B regulation protein RsbU (phosphoserine phosphatase)